MENIGVLEVIQTDIGRIIIGVHLTIHKTIYTPVSETYGVWTLILIGPQETNRKLGSILIILESNIEEEGMDNCDLMSWTIEAIFRIPIQVVHYDINNDGGLFLNDVNSMSKEAKYRKFREK